MLKINYRRQLNANDSATAGSKLDMDLNIGGPPKTSPKPASITTPFSGATPVSAPPIIPKAPSPLAIGSLDKKPGPTPKSIDQTNLNSLKQQALTKLSPLVEDLEQPPLEHFRTLMMLIQATDDSSLIHRALETADSVTDDKERAQALLDIVNEINYFTSQANKAKPAPK